MWTSYTEAPVEETTATINTDGYVKALESEPPRDAVKEVVATPFVPTKPAEMDSGVVTHVKGDVKAFEIEPPRDAATKMSVMESGIVTHVKGEFLHLYAKVNEAYLHIKVKMTEGYNAAQAKALSTLSQLKAAVGSYRLQLSKTIVLIEAKITELGTQVDVRVCEMKQKTISLCNAAKQKAINAYQVNIDFARAKLVENYTLVHDFAKEKYTLTREFAMERYALASDFAQAKALLVYTRAKLVVESIPVPIVVQNGFAYVLEKGTVFGVYIKSGTMKMYGKLGEVTLKIKAKGIQSLDAAKIQASALVRRVTTAVEPYVAKVKDGLTSMKCRVGGAVVSIKACAVKYTDEAVAKVSQTYAKMRNAIKQLLEEGYNSVKGKASDIMICIKDGYVHVYAKVDDQVCVMKAKVIEIRGQVAFQVVAKYTATKKMISEHVQPLQDAAMSVVETSKVKLSSFADKTKAAYAGRPIMGGAATGAAFVGAAGGATGGVAGLLAGAAAGVPLALLTFGLSIPAGAVIGGGAGVCVGAVAGGTAGAAGGAAAGYGYEHRAQIKTGVDGAFTKASHIGKALKSKVE